MSREKIDRKKLEETVTGIVEGYADKFRAAGVGKDKKIQGDNFTMTQTNRRESGGGHPVQFKPGESNVDSVEKDKKVSKEQVIEVYKKFVERGITSPDALDLNDPEVIKANNLFDKWQAQEDSNDERVNFEKTKLYVDAGFTDPNYLEDVLGWLMQDADNVEKQADVPVLVQLRQDIAQEIKKIRSLLRKPQAE